MYKAGKTLRVNRLDLVTITRVYMLGFKTRCTIGMDTDNTLTGTIPGIRHTQHTHTHGVSECVVSVCVMRESAVSVCVVSY